MRTGATERVRDLRRKIYVAAKSDKRKRFWGMYCHVTKEDMLQEAYRLAKENDGSPGIDGVTYKPQRNRKVEIPKSPGKVRVLGIPTIKDRGWSKRRNGGSGRNWTS